MEQEYLWNLCHQVRNFFFNNVDKVHAALYIAGYIISKFFPRWKMSCGIAEQELANLQPTAWFCTAQELRIVFTFFNGSKEKKSQRIIFCDSCKLYKIQILVSMNKVYWCTNMFIYIVSGCFYLHTAELGSCRRDRMARRALDIHYLALYRKNLQTPGLFWVMCHL